jgi:uncharacterized protein (TIGR03083 family)
MNWPGKIIVVDRFAPLRVRLLDLLTGLSANDWARPTAAPHWSVKDVAAHLLADDIGMLSRGRDRFRPASAHFVSYAEFVEFINRLNAEWVTAARRMSPRVLCELLAITGPQLEEYFSSLDPDTLGEPVNWAGPDPAPVWFDLAREFTERWHHQQQIREAVGAPALYDPYFLAPVLDAFVRGLPYSFRNTRASEGTAVRFEISGDAGGVWHVVRTVNTWQLALDFGAVPAASVILPQDVAWRMFTKGIDGERSRASAQIYGSTALAAPIFRTISIIG